MTRFAHPLRMYFSCQICATYEEGVLHLDTELVAMIPLLNEVFKMYTPMTYLSIGSWDTIVVLSKLIKKQ